MTSLAEPSLPTAARKRPWYIDEVQLSALRLQVSYRARPAGAAAEGDWRVPLALPNLEGYSLELASKRLVNFFISRRRLLEDFGKHYKGEVMRHWNKVPRHWIGLGSGSGSGSGLGSVKSCATGARCRATHALQLHLALCIPMP